MRTRDAMRILFPRKRRWTQTARWREAMLKNLSRAPRKHSAEKTWQIKQAVRDSVAMPPEQRPTQTDLARSFGVSKQRINRLWRTLPPSVLLDEADRNRESGVIPAHIAAREALLRSSVSHGLQPAETAQRQQEPSRASYPAAIHPAQIDAAILAYVGFDPNRSGGWF
jgi:hypothetical protein